MPAQSISTCSLFDRHATRLDRSAPARDLACDEFLEVLGRAALGCRNLLADGAESLSHRRQVQRLDEARAELLHDRRRRVLGEEQPLPGQDVEIQALLLCRRDARQRRRAFQAGGGDRLDVAALDLWLRGGHGIADVLYAPRDQVLHGRAEPSIRNVGDVHAEHGVEQDAAHVGGGAGAGRSELHARLVRLHIGDELLKRIHGQCLRDDERAWRLDGEAERREVLYGVVRETRSEPTVPPPPTGFSTTTVWPRASCMPCARIRPATSLGPPAANGTTSDSVPLLSVCASADAQTASAIVTMEPRRRRFFMGRS